jgi:hypothetical protein
MKKWNLSGKTGAVVTTLFAGVWVLATGCVEHQETYVPAVYPAPIAGPESPVTPPPIAVVAPAAAEMPPAPAPAPTPMMVLRAAEELDRMLAPVALYPDPLLAQLLPAATLPAQVVSADRYAREGGDPRLIDVQPWDNSLKALARYPATLRMMDDNLAWTTDLGQAFVNQPSDVMDSVQRLRARARELGNLQSTPQQLVVVNGGIIEILPAAPQVVYVPVYQPEVVYVRPPPPGRFYVSFGAGLVVGAWLNHDCDWHHHELIVWHRDHPRPTDWWSRPPSRRETTVVNNVTVVNNTVVNNTVVNNTVNNTTVVHQAVSVWRPRTGGPVTEPGKGGSARPDVRTTKPARLEAPKPASAQPHQPTAVAEASNPFHSGIAQAPSPAPTLRPGARPAQQPVLRPLEAHGDIPHNAAKPALALPTRELHTLPSGRPAPLSTPAVHEATTAKPLPLKSSGAELAKPVSAPQPPPKEVKPTTRPVQPVPALKDVHPAKLAPAPHAAPAPVTSRRTNAANPAPTAQPAHTENGRQH